MTAPDICEKCEHERAHVECETCEGFGRLLHASQPIVERCETCDGYGFLTVCRNCIEVAA
jgi:DnaJ-class molecular chaperone